MPNLTQNFNLIKPLKTENYNIDNDNLNMDAIDVQLGIHAAHLADNVAQFGGIASIYAKKQTTNMGNFINKVYKKIAFKICCMGDSLTYGVDLYSTNKRAAGSDATLDISIPLTNTIASITYPEALKQFLVASYGDIVTVVNRGIGGYKVSDALISWNDNINADIHFIMFGTNENDQNIDVSVYIANMTALVERLIGFGSAVVIITPPKMSSDVNTLDIYRKALSSFETLYGIPIIAGDEIFRGYGTYTIFSDDGVDPKPDDQTHYNGVGYSILASRIAASVISGDMLKPCKLNSNTQIAIEGSEYGYVTTGTIEGNASLYTQYAYTGVGSSDGTGLFAKLDSNEYFTMSLFSESENLVLVPIFAALPNAQAEISVDFKVTQATKENAIYYGVPDRSYSYGSLPPVNTLTFGVSLQMLSDNSKGLNLSDIDKKVLLLPQKGWHSLTIKNLGSASMFFWGFMVYDFAFYRDVIASPRNARLTKNPSSDSTVRYTKLASITFNLNGAGAFLKLFVNVQSHTQKDSAAVTVNTAFNTAGVAPTATVVVRDNIALSNTDFIAVTNALTGTTAQVELYFKSSAAYVVHSYCAIHWFCDYNNVNIDMANKSTWLAALPSGTQYVGTTS